MARRRQVTEYLVADLDQELWCCRECGAEIGDLNENYKRGCRVRDRHPHEIHDPMVRGEFTMAPDPDWCRVVEYYCPACFRLIEVEYLPPGFPPVHDIELDVEMLKRKDATEADSSGELAEA